MNYRYRLRIMLVVLFALFAAVSCNGEEASPEAAPTPTPTPVPTPAPVEQFSAGSMPLPDQEWLTRFSHMLSVVPAKYGPVLFLDMQELRYKPKVQEALTSQMAPALAAIPSAATNLIEGAVLARNSKDGGALVVLSTPLDIGTMLSVASSLEVSSKPPEPEDYRDHQIWIIEEFGASLAIGSVDKSTSVAVAGSSSGVSHTKRVKSALDTFDGLAPHLLDSAAVSLVANNLPHGVLVGIFDGCSALGSLSTVADLPDCHVAGVSAELLDQKTVAINVVAGFQDDGRAKSALQTLKDNGIRLGESVPQDSAARQEGSLVRVRLIIDFDQIVNAFDAFGPAPVGEQ